MWKSSTNFSCFTNTYMRAKHHVKYYTLRVVTFLAASSKACFTAAPFHRSSLTGSSSAITCNSDPINYTNSLSSPSHLIWHLYTFLGFVSCSRHHVVCNYYCSLFRVIFEIQTHNSTMQSAKKIESLKVEAHPRGHVALCNGRVDIIPAKAVPATHETKHNAMVWKIYTIANLNCTSQKLDTKVCIAVDYG